MLSYFLAPLQQQRHGTQQRLTSLCRRVLWHLVIVFMVLSLDVGLDALVGTAEAVPTLDFGFARNFTAALSSICAPLLRGADSRDSKQQMKSYSGQRVSNDSLLMIYYHNDTVAVVELGPQKLLLGCELIEILNEEDGHELLDNLSYYNRPLEIGFKDMIKLMSQCEQIDRFMYKKKQLLRPNAGDYLTTEAPSVLEAGISFNSIIKKLSANMFPRNPLSLLNGILPGTNWCGTGDIASNYHDLGFENEVDRCCRTHDLCPVKIRAYQRRYDLTNEHLYTKSHCVCDDMFFKCLKHANTSVSSAIGQFYFNVVRIECLEDSGDSQYRFRSSYERF